MRVALVTVLVAASLLTIGMLFLQPPAAAHDSLDMDAVASECNSACSDLLYDYRANPSVGFGTSRFCTTVFNTYGIGGIFSDHCYQEQGDLIRYECVLSSLDGTMLNVDSGRCS